MSQEDLARGRSRDRPLTSERCVGCGDPTSALRSGSMAVTWPSCWPA